MNVVKLLSRLLKNNSRTTIIFLDQAMVSGVNFTTGLLFARFLGIEEFGRFALAWMVVLFVNSLQMSLVSSPMMAFGPKQSTSQASFYFSSVMVQQLFFGLSSFFFVLIVISASQSFFPEWNISGIAFPLASAAFFFQNQDFFRRYYFTIDCYLDALTNDTISYLGQLVLLVLLFSLMNVNASKVLWVISGTSAVAVVSAVRKIVNFKWSPSVFYETVRKHWHFSKWLTASALMFWSSGNLFFVVAGNVLGPAAVGAMKASQNIMGVCHILFQGFENIVPIRASRELHLTGTKAMVDYLMKATLLGGVIVLVISLVVTLKAELWLSTLFGTGYKGYGYVLRWYSIVYVFMFLGYPLRGALRALELTKPIFLSYTVTSLFAVCFSSIMVGKFQLNGAMAGILVVYILLVIIPFGALAGALRGVLIGKK